MKMRSILFVVGLMLWTPGSPSAQQSGGGGARDLVGTWTLAAVQVPTAGGSLSSVPNPRGLLVYDAAGHALEIVTRSGRALYAAPQPTPAEAQTTLGSYGGFWGRYRLGDDKRITYRVEDAVNPNLAGQEEVRSYELSNDQLTIVSLRAQAHVPAGTRWVWQRVPVLENFSAAHRRLVGFWQHVVEQRLGANGNVLSENRRAPSVIVYTPSGYVGVHFPPLDRKRFASEAPSDEEAREAIRGYVGYFGVFTLYPGAVFHHQLASLGPGQGNTLRRFFEIAADRITLKFPPAQFQGQESRTVVTLKRLSGDKEMLP